MSSLKLLGRLAVWAVLASIIAAVFLALVAMVQTFALPPGMFTPYESARLVFLYAVIIGAPFAMIYGAPLYGLLFYRGLASCLTTLLIGFVPAAAVYFLVQNEQQLGLWVAGGRAATALLTHLTVRRS